MAQNVLLPGGVVSMTAAAADRLMKAGNGDAALLYLHLLRRGGEFSPDYARQALGWTADRVKSAFDALAALALVDKASEVASASTPPEPEGPPDYTSADIAKELDAGGAFPHLVSELERRLGKVLSPADLKILLSIYDYLALPAEVVLMLVTWCIEDTERKYGAGRKPRMSQIRKEAFIWHRLGVDTPEAADAHIKSLTRLRDRERSLLPLLGIAGRTPVEGERKFINAWVDMGFDDEAIALAYERTVLKKGALNWAYMNSILRSWHQKNLHSVPQIEAGDSSYRRAAPQGQRPAAPAGQGEARAREDMDRLRRLMGGQTDKEGGSNAL